MPRRLGQHFLFDPSILRRIADAVRIEPHEVVLEIGPGQGGLTRALMARAKRVIAVEADRALAAQLTEALAGSNVTVVAGDALKVAWPRADKVCGNIPFRITSPLIERALTAPRPAAIVFLVQREVADRLVARPGTRAYGALSAGVQLVARVERLFRVPGGAFRPPPEVDAAVVRITPTRGDAPSSADEADTRALIGAAVQRRRQQLQRTLRATAHLTPAASLAVLAEVGIGPTARPEQLGPAQFLALARVLRSA